MKINIDFDELLNRSVNASINASIKVSDIHPDTTAYAEQFERIAKISSSVTIGILREYHEMLEDSLDKLLSTR